jgi:hypothetical protein
MTTITGLKVLALSVVLVSLPVLAQDKGASSLGGPGCGDPAAKFEVKTDKGDHPTQAEAGKALVYFVEDDSNFGSFPKPTARAGVDGKWVGATHGNSYLFFAVDPGVHHLCASWQKTVILGRGHMTSAAHFTAEAGGVYYFEIKDKFIRGDTSAITDLSLTPLDSDEGQVLAEKYSLSTSHAKK